MFPWLLSRNVFDWDQQSSAGVGTISLDLEGPGLESTRWLKFVSL